MTQKPSRLPHDMHLLRDEAYTVPPSTRYALITQWSRNHPANHKICNYYAMKQKPSFIPQYMHLLRNEAETVPPTTRYAFLTQWSRNRTAYHKICTSYAMKQKPSCLPQDMHLLRYEAETVPPTTICTYYALKQKPSRLACCWIALLLILILSFKCWHHQPQLKELNADLLFKFSATLTIMFTQQLYMLHLSLNVLRKNVKSFPSYLIWTLIFTGQTLKTWRLLACQFALAYSCVCDVIRLLSHDSSNLIYAFQYWAIVLRGNTTSPVKYNFIWNIISEPPLLNGFPFLKCR